MDKLVPTPVMFPVSGRIHLSKANDDPSSPHEHTMKLVNKMFVHSVVDEFAGTNR